MTFKSDTWNKNAQIKILILKHRDFLTGYSFIKQCSIYNTTSSVHRNTVVRTWWL